MKLQFIDVTIILLYLVLMVSLGFWFRKKAQKNKESYLMGRKSLPW
ncbi:MAG: hypothetical protein ABIN89_13140 [Chitinophagaceae bacterium]